MCLSFSLSPSCQHIEYYENVYYPQYECNIPLLEQAAISATSSLRERGPENARLNGKYILHAIQPNEYKDESNHFFFCVNYTRIKEILKHE